MPKTMSELEKIAAEIESQQAIVDEFENALEDIANPPKYAAQSPSEPLKVMMAIMSQASTQEQREKAIAAAAIALANAENHLESLRLKQKTLELQSKGTELKPKIWEAAEKLQNAIVALDAAYAEFLATNDGAAESLWSVGCEVRVTTDRELLGIPHVDVSSDRIGVISRVEAKRLEASRKGSYFPREIRL
jgi:hypothetical protein